MVDVETGKPLGVGEVGELLVKSPLVMSHYWGNPDATNEAIIELPGLGYGWFRTGTSWFLHYARCRRDRCGGLPTAIVSAVHAASCAGDVVEIDNEGFVHIRDRAKDIIIRGGENISCSEVVVLGRWWWW